MILVDTSVWIEFFRGREPVAAALEEHIEAGAVPLHALVFAELLQGCKSAAEADFLLPGTGRILKTRKAKPELSRADGTHLNTVSSRAASGSLMQF